jgi:hypothetical protein
LGFFEDLMATESCMTPQVITGLFTISGVVLGGLLGFATAYGVGRINAKREAGNKLRAAFAPELASMRLSASDKKINVEQLLTSAFSKHATAVEEFGFYVPKKDRPSYYEAWRKYYEVGGSVRFFDYYMNGNGKGREVFEQRVNAILEFSKPN